MMTSQHEPRPAGSLSYGAGPTFDKGYGRWKQAPQFRLVQREVEAFAHQAALAPAMPTIIVKVMTDATIGD